MKAGKLVLALIVVGVLVVGGNPYKPCNDDDGAALFINSQAVAFVCSLIENKNLCVQSMSSVANNKNATPKDFLLAAIQVAIQEVQDGIQKSADIGKGAKDGLNMMAVEDCKELLEYAVAELHASFSSVGDSELLSLADREAELLNWLSAALTYEHTCIDGFTQPDLQKEMSNGLLNATELTGNAMAIVSAMPQIFASFNIPLNVTAASPKSLDGTKDGAENDQYFPSWMSAADRGLVASTVIGGVQLPKPDAVVAKDGSGQYMTIAAALAGYPKNPTGRYVIYVKAGVYDEYITVTPDQVNVFMYGDGPEQTIVTGHKSSRDNISTYQTASFSAIGNGFIAMHMGFENTAGPEGFQAVALRVQSDKSAFYNCRMDGYQDTLYAQSHIQFYRDCVISGTIDFIFGNAQAVIQNSLIIVKKPMVGQQNVVTAQGRDNPMDPTGIVIQNCSIVPDQALVPVKSQIPTFLGRPWKMYSRTVIMESNLGDLIQPAGWMPMNGSFALDTLYYAEYGNGGPSANTANRVHWKGYHVITNRSEALQFTAGPFIHGGQWLNFTGVPYYLGLSK